MEQEIQFDQQPAEEVVAGMSMISSPVHAMANLMPQGYTIDQLRSVFELQKEWEANEAKKAYNRDMALMQGELPDIKRVKQGYNFKYAPLDEIMGKLKGPMSKNGFASSFTTDQTNPELIGITCKITHRQGHCESNTLYGPPDVSLNKDGKNTKNKLQEIGSSGEYLRRYTFIQILGLTAGDDDVDAPVEDVMLTVEELGTLQAKIKEVKANLPRFLKFMKVDKIEDIHKSQLVKAMNVLEAAQKAK